ncbi:MAG TPA: ankyrin repeat domain-containing protein [Vicinamibacterales bacterium]|nr:ankyrin repeat domain-containing protein [Vicinamibacterales bacterium]
MGEQKTPAAQIARAIKDRDIDGLRRLLSDHPEQVASFTPIGAQTWVGYAAQVGNLPAVELLAHVGADLSRGDERENSAPICSAAFGNHQDVVTYLLKAGVPLDTSMSVRNPLFAAIVGRSSKIVRILLEAGIDSTVRYNSSTMTDMDAVAFALMRGERECAQIIALWNAKGAERAAETALRAADQIAEVNAYGRRRKQKT